MNCNICGATTRVIDQHAVAGAMHVLVDRVCANGHRVRTHEVHTTMLADKREMRSAVRNIQRRIKLFERDRLIMQDPRPARVVAEEHNITEARVRQIRAGFIDPAPLAHNSERTAA